MLLLNQAEYGKALARKVGIKDDDASAQRDMLLTLMRKKTVAHMDLRFPWGVSRFYLWGEVK